MKVFLPLVRPMALYMANIMIDHFEDVIYFKPSLNLTSSEIYLVGKKYKGISSILRIKKIDLNSHSLYSSESSESSNFSHSSNSSHSSNLLNLNKHYHACNQLISNTIHGINKYLFFYYYMDEKMKQKLTEIQFKAVDHWVKKYHSNF